MPETEVFYCYLTHYICSIFKRLYKWFQVTRQQTCPTTGCWTRKVVLSGDRIEFMTAHVLVGRHDITREQLLCQPSGAKHSTLSSSAATSTVYGVRYNCHRVFAVPRLLGSKVEETQRRNSSYRTPILLSSIWTTTFSVMPFSQNCMRLSTDA